MLNIGRNTSNRVKISDHPKTQDGILWQAIPIQNGPRELGVISHISKGTISIRSSTGNRIATRIISPYTKNAVIPGII